MTFHFCNRIVVAGCLAVLSCGPLYAQMAKGENGIREPLSWVMQESGTTAGLRGIDSIDGKIAWASGTGGTVLRTVDGGEHWTRCAVPDAATDGATLDFRGVQAWDAQTAIVMASGPGEKSRLYKTMDGCKSWRLVFWNREKEGFWDAIRVTGPKTGLLIGDPLPHSTLDRLRARTDFYFPLYATTDGGSNWIVLDDEHLFALSDGKGKPASAIFAASNSELVETHNHQWILFAEGGKSPSIGLLEFTGGRDSALCKSTCFITGGAPLPLSSGPAAGAFSLDVRDGDGTDPTVIAVGGDYTKPQQAGGTSATCRRGSKILLAAAFRCVEATTPPHGYRSAVAWNAELQAWIAVGTNGSDISRDDGKTWAPLDDGNWNALSLPFVVGPGGRIARLTAVPR